MVLSCVLNIHADIPQRQMPKTGSCLRLRVDWHCPIRPENSADGELTQLARSDSGSIFIMHTPLVYFFLNGRPGINFSFARFEEPSFSSSFDRSNKEGERAEERVCMLWRRFHRSRFFGDSRHRERL